MPSALPPSLLLLGAGLVLLTLGLLRRRVQARRLQGRGGLPGTVVDETMGAGDSWLPVIAYTAPDGVERRVVPRSSSWHGVSRIGRTVTVVPDPDDYGRVDADGVGPREGGMLVLASALFLVPGVLGLLTTIGP